MRKLQKSSKEFRLKTETQKMLDEPECCRLRPVVRHVYRYEEASLAYRLIKDRRSFSDPTISLAEASPEISLVKTIKGSGSTLRALESTCLSCRD